MAPHEQFLPDTYTPLADTPDWFLANLQQAGESHFIDIDGGRLHYLDWDRCNVDSPVLLLVHGFSGHANWWSFLAPFFTDRYRVIAVDLPGMGDSGPWREYNDDSFSLALLALITGLELKDVRVIGHSFGGIQVIRAMARQPEAFQRAIIVDSFMRFSPKEQAYKLPGRPAHNYRSSRQACMERFSLMPPQSTAIEAIEHFIAFHSCTRSEQGWHWKFDPRLTNAGELDNRTLLTEIPNRVDCIYGEQSVFNTEDFPARVLESFPNRGLLEVIPNAHHHLMIDHPLELVDALNRLLALPC